MAGIKFDITGDNSNVLEAFNGVQQGVRQTQQIVEESGTSIEDMFKRIGAAAGIAFSLNEAKSFVSKVVEMRSFFQDIESSMKVFLGNEKKAAEFTQQLKDYAYYNMFEFKDLAEASQQMIAYGHDIDTIIPKLDQLSNIAVGTHGNLMDLVAIYNKAKSTGVVDAHSLQSWAVKGVVVKDILKEMGEEATGTSVTFEQLNKVLDHVTGEGGMFHNLQGEMMENISAEIGQFEDNFNAMLNEIGEKYQEQIISGIKLGSELIDNYQTLAGYIQDAVVAYGLYKTALATANALDKARTVGLFALTASERIHYGALVLEEKAQALLNKTILANPYVLATMAVAGLAFGIYKLVTAEDAETAARRRANEKMEEFKGKLEEQKSRITSYIQTVQDANATDYEKALAWENLSKEAPTLTQAYTQAEMAAMDFGDAQKHINSIMDEADYQHAKDEVKKWEEEVAQANKNLNAFGGGGLLEKFTKIFRQKDLDAALAGLNEVKKVLDDIENRRKEIAEKNKPIEIRVKEANDNVEDKQAILNFYDKAITLAHEVEKAMNEQDYSQAVQNFDDYVATIQKEVDDLKDKAEKNPMDMKLRLEADEKHRMLDELLQMKAGFVSMGVTTIPFTIRLNYENAKAEADAAKQAKEGMHWVADSVSLAGGHWEADTPTIVKTSAEWQKELRKNLTAAKKELSDFENGTGAYKDKKMTKEERDAERKHLDAAVSDAKKALGSDPTKARSEYLRKQKELQKYNDLIEQQKLDRKRAVIDLLFSTTQAEIDALEDGNEKTIAQINLDFKKRGEEIERAYEDLKQKKIDAARKLWEANPANKGKAFDESTVDTEYSQAEIDNKEAQVRANIAEYARQIKNVTDTEIQNMYDYLKEYGSMQSMKLAIAKEYDRKIAEEEDEWRKKSLQKEKQTAIDNLTAENLLQQIDLGTVFSDYGQILAAPLQQTIERLEAYTKTNAFKQRSIEDQRSIYEAIQNAKGQLGGITGISFSEIGQNLYEYNNALVAFNVASEELETAVGNTIQAEEDLAAARQELAKATTDAAKATAQQKVDTAQGNVNNARGKQAQAETTFYNAQARMTQAQQKASSSLEKLQQSIDNVGNIARGVASGSLKQLWDALGKKTQVRIAQFITGTKIHDNAVQAMTNTLAQSGKGMDYLTERVKALASDVMQSGDDISGVDIGGKIANLFSELFGSDNKDINKFGKELGNVLTNVLTKAKEGGEDAEDAVEDAAKTVIKETLGTSNSILAMIINLILDLLDVLAEGLGTLVEGLLNSVGNAIEGILTEIGSGKFFERVFTGVGNVIGGVVKGIGNLFSGGFAFGGSNVDDMEEEIADLAAANEALAKSIDTLSNNISKSDNTNKQSVEAYKKALDAEKEWEANQRKAINDRASEWSNSGHGFLGLGGKHSFNKNLNDNGKNWWGWSEFNQVLGQNGYTNRVNTAEGLWNLTPEMLKLLRDYAPKAWAQMLKTDGESNPSALIDEYIDRAGKIEELTSALNEKLTGYSWDGFLDSYKSLLKDMSSETEDFTDKMEEMITNALIENLVNEEFKQRIKDLYQYIADHAGDGLDEGELNYIRGENEKIANEMIARRQNLIDAGLLKPDTDYEQEASKKGFAAMSQDTGEELNGRFTALQISGENISQQMLLVVATLNSVASFSGATNAAVLEIRDMLIFTNSYLEDMVKYAKLLYKEFGEKLDDIVEHTK